MSRLAMQDAIEADPWRMDAGLIHTNPKANAGPAPLQYPKNGAAFAIQMAATLAISAARMHVATACLHSRRSHRTTNI